MSESVPELCKLMACFLQREFARAGIQRGNKLHYDKGVLLIKSMKLRHGEHRHGIAILKRYVNVKGGDK